MQYLDCPRYIIPDSNTGVTLCHRHIVQAFDLFIVNNLLVSVTSVYLERRAIKQYSLAVMRVRSQKG